MSENAHVSRPFLFYVFCVCAIAALVFAVSWAQRPASFSLQLLLLVAAVLLSENFSLSLESYSVSLAFPLGLAAAVLCGPAASCIVAATSSINLPELRQRKPVSVVLFNLGQLILSTGLSACCYVWLGGRILQSPSGAVSPWGRADFPGVVIPMIALAAVCVVGNMLLAAVGMALFSGQPLRSTISAMVAYVPNQFALAGVGFLIADTLAISPLALPLFIAPLVVARQLYMRYAGLKTAFVDTVRSLIGALEAKDPYTRGHSERVSQYTAILGRASGLSPREIERLEYAALLHDLGKLAVPGPILVKPGRLNDDEMSVVRQHPDRGGEMVKRIPPLRDLVDAVTQHHEWFDGSGYPGGISGSDLTAAARILGVADSYDAMTSTRSYRPALSRPQAVAELIRGAGSQFDPEVVRLFIEFRVGLSDGAEVAVADKLGPSAEPQHARSGG